VLSEHEDVLKNAAEWIRQGGRIALERFGQAVAERKADRSFVTDADHAVQAYLLDQIARHCPSDAVITEETQAAPDRHAGTGAERCWIIDPIDGTRSYARSFPGFSISIGLIERGTPVVGMVYNPLTGQLYTATAGGGAWLGERRLRVTDAPLGRDTLLAIPSSRRGPMPQAVHDWIDRFVVRNLGSTALHLALLAAGSLDAVFADECKLWDIAAGELLVREAGGQLLSLDGRPYFPIDLNQYNRTDTPFMAAGPRVLKTLLDEYLRAVSRGERDL
jgi:myo-inositol-1(or 4)-monophosphatase